MNINYSVSHYINQIAGKIAAAYDDDILSQQYAWWILQAICCKTKTELIMQATLILNPAQQQKIDDWIRQLVVDKIPLQYLLGAVPFAECDILVEPPILIPRPETEEWCLYVIELLGLLSHKKIKILDICTGSGCIAIALSYHVPMAEIVATDISDKALQLTAKNMEWNKIKNVTVIKSDLFAAIAQDALFDMIVSNPPYITEKEFAVLEDSVVLWEDHGALLAADEGLAIIKKIIHQAPDFIQKNEEMQQKNIPQLVIEIGYNQGIAVKNIMQAAGYNQVVVHKDLEGKDRFVTGRVDYVANSRS